MASNELDKNTTNEFEYKIEVSFLDGRESSFEILKFDHDPTMCDIIYKMETLTGESGTNRRLMYKDRALDFVTRHVKSYYNVESGETMQWIPDMRYKPTLTLIASRFAN